MTKLLFAPLQGYTHWIYRQTHHEIFGGVDSYYTPFLRYEHGEIRNKDCNDVAAANNRGVPVVPQVIASDIDEFCRLCDYLQQTGWERIDLNAGCPFPMQVHVGRGSGLLSHPDRMEAILREMERRTDVNFSLKMRLGQESQEEAFILLPMLNESSLAQITLHSRLGVQQYKGDVDRDSFPDFITTFVPSNSAEWKSMSYAK